MIELFKRPVRVMQFYWKDPKPSDEKKNVMILCKEEVNPNFGVILNTNEQTKVYLSQYVRSKVCPNDEYLFVINEDGIQV
ncbi:unnamed protein product [Meloidogyne enterolobii]|uniref:Uncharacterized protein n=1 Tax=Meloidogyne enterolobii TaxID=390850 RepID=A0ACB1AR49_MELEN